MMINIHISWQLQPYQAQKHWKRPHFLGVILKHFHLYDCQKSKPIDFLQLALTHRIQERARDEKSGKFLHPLTFSANIIIGRGSSIVLLILGLALLVVGIESDPLDDRSRKGNDGSVPSRVESEAPEQTPTHGFSSSRFQCQINNQESRFRV